MQFLAPADGVVVLDGTAASPSLGSVQTATLSNLGANNTSGWAVGLDSEDMLSSLFGGTFTSPRAGVYIVTPSTEDGQISADGYMSFSFIVQSLSTDPAITAQFIPIPS